MCITDFLCGPAYIGPGAGITFLGSFLVLFVALALLGLSILTWPVRFLLLWLKRRRLKLKPLTSRVVIIGLDGLDPGIVRRLMQTGRMPNFQKLAQTGMLSDLQTTLPPISPVAWSSFQTGVNPGKHNIYDFLNRDLRTYLPELSSARVLQNTATGFRKWLKAGASVRLLRKSQPFWKVLGDHGIFSTILRVPITFPPERFFGLSLSAMCTPDLRGTQGSFTLFTTDSSEVRTESEGLRILVHRTGNRVDAMLPGPPTSADGQPQTDYQTALKIQVAANGQQVEVRTVRDRIILPLCRESDWVRVEFRVNWFTRVRGLCKLRLESVTPHFRLYVSPIHMDPERPAMPISHPLYFAMYLSHLHNSFATLGLAEDTWGLNSGAVGEDAFLEQAWCIHNERERILLDSLRRMQRGLTVCVFDAPDRIQHMFWRHNVPNHPANQGRKPVTHAHVIDDMYAEMDALVGRVQQELKQGDVLFVLSDHGFCDFSRGINLNVWLREHGYLVLKDSETPGDYFAGVDWSKTRAYAFGLTGIYLNQIGREGQGIVSPDDASALRQEIVAALSNLQDPQTGQSAAHQIYDCHQMYFGPYVNNGPDVIVGYQKGYRASWENAVGRVDGPLFRDNDHPWSGDHCVDPQLVPGVLLSNCGVTSRTVPSILDFAPTILRLFGVPQPEYMDGRAWDVSVNQTPPAPICLQPAEPPAERCSAAEQSESTV